MKQSYIIVIIMMMALSACSKQNNDSSQNELVSEPPAQGLQGEKVDENLTSKSVEQSNSSNNVATDNTFKTGNEHNTDILKSETMSFVKALHNTFNGNIQEQERINQKLQQATNRADDDIVMQMSLDMFNSQRLQIQSLPLSSDKLINVREKIIKALDLKIDVNQKSLALRSPNPEDEQRFVSMLQESKKLSNEANNNLNALIQEQGIIF